MNISFISYQIRKVSTEKDHGKNYMKDRPPLVRHLLRNYTEVTFNITILRLFSISRLQVAEVIFMLVLAALTLKKLW